MRMTLPSKIQEGIRHPFTFIVRQLYKLCIVLPYQLLVWCFQCVRSWQDAPHASSGSGMCVIMTSLIGTAPTPLSYGTRSIFSASERAEQTRRSIASVRARISGAHIVLVEAGDPGVVPADIIASVDTYLPVGGTWWVRAAVNSRYKSFGEASMLLASYRLLPTAELYFKMSGRYVLSVSFSLREWSGGMFHMYYIRPDFVSTRLYSFTRAAVRLWYFALVKSLPLLWLDYPIEFLLQKYIPSTAIARVPAVGIQGFDAVSGVPVSE